MGLSGLVGGGAVDALDRIIVQQMAKKRFAEELRAQQVQEQQAAERAAQQQQQFEARLAFDREREAADSERANEAMQQGGIADMRDQQERQRVHLTRLTNESAADEALSARPDLKVLADLQRVGMNVPASMAQSPKDRADAEAEARKQERDDYDWKNQNDAKYRARPEPKTTGPGGLNPGQLTTAKQFQDDYARDSKTYVVVRNAYQQVAGAANNPDAAGDLSLIFGYMKMLDPNSVVRETEFANAQNAAGVPDRVRNLYNRAMSGERLNPNQRKEFVGQARRIMQTAHTNQSRVRKTYHDRATKFGIDPTMVLDDEEPLDTPHDEAGPALVPSHGGGGAAPAPQKKFTILGVK